MNRLCLVLDSVALADPRVDTRDLMQQMMWAKHEYNAQVFTLATRRAFEMTSQAELEARAAGAQTSEHHSGEVLPSGYRPIRELAHDENAWAIALLSDRIFDPGGTTWPMRAWKHAARGRAPIVLIRNGALTVDEERQVEDVNRADRRVFEVIDLRTTLLDWALPDVLARAVEARRWE